MATLLAEWGMLDNLLDTSGNGRHASANFTPTYIDGPHPHTRAAQFTTGTTQTITYGRTGLEPASGGVVTMGWVLVPDGTTPGYDGVMHKSRDGGGSTRGGSIILNERRLRPMSRWDGGVNYSEGIGPQAAPGTWMHFAHVDADDRYEWYVDGVSVGGGARSGPFIPETWQDHPWISGRYLSETASQAGLAITGVRIFRGSLSDSEVVTWMNTPIAWRTTPATRITTIAAEARTTYINAETRTTEVT